MKLRAYCAGRGVLVLLTAVLLTACAQVGGSTASPSATSSPTLDAILARGELVVGTAANMPPLSMTTRSGEIIGLEADLANYLAYTMGVKLRLEKMQFSKLLRALESGEVDMVISYMTITPRRNLKVAFAGPYFVSGKCVLTRREALASMESAADINAANLKLTALEGSTSQEFVERLIPSATLVTSPDADAGVARVLSGEVDAMLADYPVCLVTHARYPDEGLVSVITRLTYEPLGIALPANDPLLLNFVENLLGGLALSGRLNELNERWFGDARWLEQLP
jgi:polar amino acid transport system substrate-binding protein